MFQADFSATDVLIMSLGSGIGGLIMFLAGVLGRRKKKTIALTGLVVSLLVIGVSLGYGLSDALSNYNNDQTRLVLRDIMKENVGVVTYVDIVSKTVELEFGKNHCKSPTFSLARAWGHDPDGWQYRWRPVTFRGTDHLPAGIDRTVLQPMINRCDARPAQD